MGDFYLLVLCSLISDFLIQSDKTVILRKSKELKESLKGHVIHFIEVGIPLCFSFIFMSKNYKLSIELTLILSLVHIIIDFIKCAISNNVKIDETILFIIDQVLHILVIYILWIKIDFKYDNMCINNINTIYINNMLVHTVLGMYVIFAGSKLIDLIMDSIPKFYEKEVYVECAITEENKVKSKISEYVGMAERFLIYVFIINNQYSALGLIIAGKSIARFEQFKDKNFADRYILGTFLSMSIAIIGGNIALVIL